MAYYPQSFKHTRDETTGLLKYEDPRVQQTYLNLRIISDLVYDLQTRARIDLLDAINYIKSDAVKNQTYQILGMFGCKILEGISAFFPGGTTAAWASMLIGRITSGVISQLVKESTPDDDIQSKANDIRDGMDAIFDSLKREIDTMIVSLEEHWGIVYHCDGYSDPALKGDTSLADLADYDYLLPDKENPSYDDLSVFLQARCRYILVSNLLPSKWRVKLYPSYYVKDYYQNNGVGDHHFDFDYDQYNPHDDSDFWAQSFTGIPERDFPPGWIVGTEENGKSSSDFVSFVKDLASQSYMIDEYSSFCGYMDATTSVDGSRHYVGNIIHFGVLVDSNGDKAPKVLSNWLFKDSVDGSKISKYGIAMREDVFRNWNLSRYNYAFKKTCLQIRNHVLGALGNLDYMRTK